MLLALACLALTLQAQAGRPRSRITRRADPIDFAICGGWLLNTNEVKDQFAKDGAEIVQMSPAESSRFFLAELEKWGKVVKEANIKAE